METLIKKYNQLSLKKYLVFSVIAAFGVIVLLSALTIWGCISFRTYLLPESNSVFLTVDETYSDGREHTYSMRVDVGKEGAQLPMLLAQDGTFSERKETTYTIERIENSVDSLTPKRKVAYHICGVIMVVFPLLFSIAGILLCGFQFYKRKLSMPLKLLSEATRQIQEQNLDFCVHYENADEMGTLCSSFEQMRSTLYDNYHEMWSMLEERRLLQASIAHDLRNPIAVIEGYTEYLQMNLEKGNLSEKRILKIAANLNLAARRLEHYTESVRTLNQMEDIEINRQRTDASELLSDMEEDLKIMAQKNNVHLKVEREISNEEIWIDTSVLYRVLENVFGNALRYAKEYIYIEPVLKHHNLSLTITDDGKGFADEILARQKKMFLTEPSEEGHLGIGLAISRILCKKHGGSLEINNNASHNAVVKINFLV